MISLYIHIPFCIKKCGYCDFISFKYDEKLVEDYLDDIKKELIYYGTYIKEPIETIFIGGGTPSLLTGDQMKALFDVIHEQFDMSLCKEVSMESNPGTLHEESLIAYRQAGVNRISMGVQSLNNSLLKTLDRIHDVQAVYDSVDLIRKTGFDNFNMDLMFGLPGQTIDDLKETLNKMLVLEPAHISAYSLKYEEGTPFYQRLEIGDLEAIEDELDRQMYHLIVETLKAHGYDQYEISNFSKKGYECLHNLVYWEKKDYIGIGVGAHGYYDKKRCSNEVTLKAYHEAIAKKGRGQVSSVSIDLDEDLFEWVMLGLRLNKGIDVSVMKKKFPEKIVHQYLNIIEELVDKDLLMIKGNDVTLTSLGRDLSNQVFMAFLD